jgi:mannose-6-phosphate isomerase-like protein (cupin superfamily)
MKGCLVSALIMLLPIVGVCQNHRNIQSIEPEVAYDNVHVLALNSDSLSSSFLIWVKKSVTKHLHQHHTENIYVLEGAGLMLIGADTLFIKEGDHIVVEPNTPHAVWVKSSQPLKVLSIQSPFFDGNDRLILE